MHDNDETIFKYLDPVDNDILCNIRKEDLNHILSVLNRYCLGSRDNLGLDDNDTFGIEIETEHFKGTVYDRWPFQLKLNEIVGNNGWESKNDITLDNGIEIASDILTDNLKTWNDIKNVCAFTSEYLVIGDHSSGHIHVGAHILGENALYWYRLFKLCMIYENIIYRFSYGEYLTHRSMVNSHAKPTALFFKEGLARLTDLDMPLLDMLYIIQANLDRADSLKNFGNSYWHMMCDENYDMYGDYNKMTRYCTMEFRSPNGTLNHIIWQNNINFFVKLMKYCKSNNFNDDILNRRELDVQSIYDNLCAYSRIYLDQALELSDMIFDNNLDKIYFLRQYLKSFEETDKILVRARKFTMGDM